MSNLNKKIFYKKVIFEMPIGSTLLVDNYKIGVIENIDECCKDCFFYNFDCSYLKCFKENRKDNKDVKFIR